MIGEFPAQMAINAENISIDDVIMVLTWEMCNIEITKGCPDQYATMYLSKYLLFICTLSSNKLVLNWIVIWIHKMDVFSQQI